jgi:DNA-binding transcriptional LysR family regulator
VLGGVTLCRHGAGLLQTFRYAVQRDLEEGRLKEVMKTHAGGTRPFSVVYPGHRHMPLRVRVFIDFLLSRLAKKRRA